MRISKEVRNETLRKIKEIGDKTFGAGDLSLQLVLEVFRPIEKENPEVAEFIVKALKTYCEIPVENPGTRQIFFGICLFALADMFRRQEEINKLERLLNQ